MKYVPLFDNVLVKEIDLDEGIIAYQEDQFGRTVAAEVVAVGPGSKKTASQEQTPPLATGDIVYFSLRDGKNINLDGREFFIVDIYDILVKEING